MERAISTFYGERNEALFWLDPAKNGARAAALLRQLRDAGEHGLSPGRYNADALVRTYSELDSETRPETLASLDRALSRAYVRFAQDLNVGAVDPNGREWEIYLDIIRPDSLSLLRRAAFSRDLAGMLAALAPRDPRYKRMRNALGDLMEQAQSGGWGDPLTARSFRRGARSSQVSVLRRRLMALGDLPPEPELTSSEIDDVAVYDERLMGAVAAFQRRHGLTPDGVAGPATLRELNVPIEKRIAQVMLNLERMRWRGHEPLGRRIEVNPAAFQMIVYDDLGAPIHTARVIVGQSEIALQTPDFSDEMSYLVLNPTWTVPKSIVTRKMLDEGRKDPSFFEKNHMRLLRGQEEVDPHSVDWDKQTRRSFRAYNVVQSPGPLNALGDVKFMFPNRHAIYLHDTPSQHLFASDKRAYSHGCVRIERPFALAYLLLSEQVEDPGDYIEQRLATGSESNAPLDRPIHIRLAYMTAWIDEAGVLNFRDDIYERDPLLARAMSDETAAIIASRG